MPNINLSHHMITWGGEAFLQFLDDVYEVPTHQALGATNQ